ncbi:restriction endonuclease subunit S [Helicobacter pylori]|uniref:restriction endonuclease subunit S n=1 Tax=Helicobacter pylori TaxID=210 RepID=UPI000FDE188B|nr:restriction endonuclease subunit S [Helicobacter pylori]RVY84284.1 restriction endonuclease subunit S [Helicobacter pylori]WQW85654.1 restriction endonuclease subunit S [Helicobacter pylori]
MNHIEKLLQTLAPKGVEFRKLGEVCDFQKGKSITKKAVTFGKVPVISGGRQPAYYHNEANRSGETIAISSSGVYAGYVSYWDIPVFLADSFSVSPKQKTLMPKYLFHYLTTQQDAIHATKSAGGIPHVYSKDLQNFLIPIPPLEIQQEIVKILDAFTELNTELKARKKQYEYYQNMLLDFNDINSNHKDAKEKLAQKTYPKRLKTLLQTLAPKGVEFRKIGEICLIKRGRVIAKKILQENGKYPVYSSQTLNNGILGFIDTYDFDGEFLTWTTDGAYAGSVFYRNGRFSITNVCGLLQVIQDNILHKYLYYILQITAPLYVSSGMGNPKLMSVAMQQITIPIPPLEIQQEIVKILDQFSLLTTDLLAGIPAEIKARKKQYEYYREKLLTFKPLTPLNNKELA